MKQIPLTQNKFALVDDEDYEWLNNYKWYFNYIDYAVSYFKKDTLRMHRLIMKAPRGIEIDHIDGNGLNNQKFNLRFVTHQQNLFNQKLNSKNTSGYKGIYWFKPAKKWRIHIKINKKQIHLGYSLFLEEAIKIRKAAEIKYFGKFSRLNIV